MSEETESTVKFTIDGKEVEAAAGTTILQVARISGVEIPTLCYYEGLESYGACRLCSVEVKRRNRIRVVASCLYPVAEGIEVYTNTERIKRGRMLAMELLLARCSDSPEIREIAAKFGVTKPRFTLSQEDCTLCGLCVRACGHLMKVGAISFVGRGAGRKVDTPYGDRSEVCVRCGACAFLCPTKAIGPELVSGEKPSPILSEFEVGQGSRKAIYSPFPQAVPKTPVIDRKHCAYFVAGACGTCEKVCPAGAILYDQEDMIVTEKVGAIVVATGYDLIPTDVYEEYGGGKYKDIISGLQFERLISASGPTGGKLTRPSNGEVPKSVVFIQCVGSRDPSIGRPYCSKICCMYTAKHAMLLRHKVHGAQAYVFYIDVRAGGKNYEEFVRRAIEKDGAVYLRGRVSKIFDRNGRLVVRGADTLSGAQVEIEADMVVLATAMTARQGADTLAQKLKISYDEFEFYSEAHPKLRPVETNTAGVYLAGACQAPKDIPDSVSQASATAGKILGLFASDKLKREPLVAEVNEGYCTACWFCVDSCPFGAAEKKEIRNRRGKLVKIVASINKAVCQGCGLCVSNCRPKAIELHGFTDEQVAAQVDALVWR